MTSKHSRTELNVVKEGPQTKSNKKPEDTRLGKSSWLLGLCSFQGIYCTCWSRQAKALQFFLKSTHGRKSIWGCHILSHISVNTNALPWLAMHIHWKTGKYRLMSENPNRRPPADHACPISFSSIRSYSANNIEWWFNPGALQTQRDRPNLRSTVDKLCGYKDIA